MSWIIDIANDDIGSNYIYINNQVIYNLYSLYSLYSLFDLYMYFILLS